MLGRGGFQVDLWDQSLLGQGTATHRLAEHVWGAPGAPGGRSRARAKNQRGRGQSGEDRA